MLQEGGRQGLCHTIERPRGIYKLKQETDGSAL